MHGRGLVLEVASSHDPDIFATDDEVCWTTWIEISSEAVQHPPTETVDPRAFLKRCSCVWGNCREEPLVNGKVTIRDVTSQGVRADVDLKFHSRAVHNSGFFAYATPHWTTMWDDEEVKQIRARATEEIEKLQIEENDSKQTP